VTTTKKNKITFAFIPNHSTLHTQHSQNGKMQKKGKNVSGTNPEYYVVSNIEKNKATCSCKKGKNKISLLRGRHNTERFFNIIIFGRFTFFQKDETKIC